MNGKSDVTALGVAVIAVPISLFTTPGPYSWFSVAISVTLLALIFAYGYEKSDKSVWRQIAVACVVGLASIPAIGAAYDISVSCSLEKESCLADHWHLAAWFSISVLAFGWLKNSN